MPIMVGKPAGGRELGSRLIIAGAVLGVAMLALAARLYTLQIRKGEEYRERSRENYVKETRLPADRGMVLDHRGRILVDSRPSYNVTLTPAFCQPAGAPKGFCLNEVLPRLATYLSLDAEEVARITEQYKKARRLERFRDFVVKVDVEMDALDRLEANRLELPGIDVIAAPHRYYRFGSLAAHVLGYMNEISGEELETFEREGKEGYQLGDYIGRRGVERRFEHELKGRDGKLKTIVDAKGRKISNSDALLTDEKPIPAQSGHALGLSLNLPLQQTAEEVFTAQAGAVVVVDVNTGFLLVVVSKPAYDPNKLTGRITRSELRAISEDPLEPLIFRAVQQHYHPGSTWKVVTALAGLEAGTIGRNTQVSCSGGYSLGNRRWRCHKESGHGIVDLHHAISWSCDTFFYAMGDRTGIDPLAQMARQLGFGRVPGLELSPEVPGIVPSVEYHNRVTAGGYTKGLVLNSAIGQGDNNVSPLQLVMAYAAIANGGTLYKPQVVRRIEDGEGHLIQSIEPVVVGKLQVKPQNLAMVTEGLRAVVNEPGGTAYWKRLKEVEVAGKTGTAQVIALGAGPRLKEEQMGYFQRDHAWFVAFAPAEKPEIAVVVLDEHGGHGGSVSAPPAMEIIKKYFSLKEESSNGESPAKPSVTPRPAGPLEPIQVPPPSPAHPRQAKGVSQEQEPWS